MGIIIIGGSPVHDDDGGGRGRWFGNKNQEALAVCTQITLAIPCAAACLRCGTNSQRSSLTARSANFDRLQIASIKKSKESAVWGPKGQRGSIGSRKLANFERVQPANSEPVCFAHTSERQKTAIGRDRWNSNGSAFRLRNRESEKRRGLILRGTIDVQGQSRNEDNGYCRNDSKTSSNKFPIPVGRGCWLNVWRAFDQEPGFTDVAQPPLGILLKAAPQQKPGFQRSSSQIRLPLDELAGKGAQQFARAMGFTIEDDLNTPKSRELYLEWKRRTDPQHYIPLKDRAEFGWKVALEMVAEGKIDPDHVYGTIHCSAVNSKGEICGTTSTSGLAWKIPGRIADSPIIGAGLYVDGDAGAAGSTGRGESNLLGLGSFIVVEFIR